MADLSPILCNHLTQYELTRVSTPRTNLVCSQYPGPVEPIMEPDTPKQWPSAQIDTMITVITPWIRSLLLQLTMVDPVKVMLVTIIIIILIM